MKSIPKGACLQGQGVAGRGMHVIMPGRDSNEAHTIWGVYISQEIPPIMNRSPIHASVLYGETTFAEECVNAYWSTRETRYQCLVACQRLSSVSSSASSSASPSAVSHSVSQSLSLSAHPAEVSSWLTRWQFEPSPDVYTFLSRESFSRKLLFAHSTKWELQYQWVYIARVWVRGVCL